MHECMHLAVIDVRNMYKLPPFMLLHERMHLTVINMRSMYVLFQLPNLHPEIVEQYNAAIAGDTADVVGNVTNMLQVAD